MIDHCNWALVIGRSLQPVIVIDRSQPVIVIGQPLQPIRVISLPLQPVLVVVGHLVAIDRCDWSTRVIGHCDGRTAATSPCFGWSLQPALVIGRSRQVLGIRRGALRGLSVRLHEAAGVGHPQGNIIRTIQGRRIDKSNAERMSRGGCVICIIFCFCPYY